ncbi:beta-lactamase family protein [Streptomyces sp. A7024]|uniref:Beta-lactamase family protein n=1 Tax=Streptomyces coryli TaxID=1128680 RepID=A0A6G4TVC3_9ACTN|nr:serine hydrolase domain-containing protein [Streptomyces coryli]NGN63959.1 beta-lactamase family protein [Streptomyces coryli]
MARTTVRRTTASVLTAAALVAAVAPSAGALAPDRGEDPVQQGLERLVDEHDVPGALAYDGRTTRTAGTAELGTDRPMPGPDDSFRIASVTKSFTATAVMRLVAKGELGLDDRAGRYVPQLKGSDITVRQLLKQRTGLAEYATRPDWNRPEPYTPEEFLELSLRQGPDFAPDADWGYSNTNYLVLGMIIGKVSGTDFRTYIERHILQPLGLDHTYWPGRDELTLRGPHARNYGIHPAHPEDGRTDVTELPGYLFGPSGGLVSTPRDLDAFWDGLFRGRLLPKWAVRQMTHDATEVGGQGPYPVGSKYGYGLVGIPLSCGGTHWGHEGDLPGDSVLSGRTAGGRTVTVYGTTNVSPDEAAVRELLATADAAFCKRR